MLSKADKIRFTIAILFGAAIQIVTSLTWQMISSDKVGAGQATFGEAYFMCGQAVGELIWLLAIRLLVVRKLLFGELIIEYLICLILVDLVSIIFLNPYEIELSKTAAFSFATLGYLYMIKYI